MKIGCPQCAGEVELGELTAVAECGHCQSSLYVDLGGVILHQSLGRELDEREARRQLGHRAPRRGGRLAYYPFWFWHGEQGKAVMTPADSHLAEDFAEDVALAGRVGSFASDPAVDRVAVPPDISLRSVLAPDRWRDARPRLVHVPFFEFGDAPARVLIDAVTGRLRSFGPITGEPSGEAFSQKLFAGLTALYMLAFLAPDNRAKGWLAALVTVVAAALLLRPRAATRRRAG